MNTNKLNEEEKRARNEFNNELAWCYGTPPRTYGESLNRKRGKKNGNKKRRRK